MNALSFFKVFNVVVLLFPILGYGNDIMINEIMANPKDGKLPAFEYIELYNNSKAVINLAEINLQVNNQTVGFSNYLLAPQQYVILCSAEGENTLSSYGNVLPLTKWTTLNNTGATIRLIRNDTVIDEVNYKDNWHTNTTKKSGGWSLEKINPNWLCNISSNWTSSTASKGGTPGAPNSAYNKAFIPSVEIVNARAIGKQIHFKLNIDKIHLPELTTDMFQLNDHAYTPTQLAWNESQDSLILSFEQSLAKDKLYKLSAVKPITICGQNIHIPFFLTFEQSNVSFNDVVINEILFNPNDGGNDFIEIYNRSPIPINLQNWKLGNRILSSNTLILEPLKFIVFTVDKAKLIHQYPNSAQDYIIQLPSLPAYPNQQGTVTLYSPTALIDSVYYNADMHSNWINNSKGVSLEREDYEKDSNLAGNFRSASTLIGGATPGYENSTIVDNFSSKDFFQLSSPTFSPDGDSFEDRLEINYQLQTNNNIINLYIYNDKGTLIKRLIRSESLGKSGLITWDGIDENGIQAAAGHYIYWAEVYNDKGYLKVYRSAFVLVRKSLRY